MASMLQQQLNAARKAVRAPNSAVPRGKPSLVFSPQEAADIDIRSIQEIAAKGFLDLCELDARLQPFLTTLFAPAATEIDRDAQTFEQTKNLDVSLAAVLSLMADHFLLPAAVQALEFLIRRFSVHQHNQEALMRSFLVYHETKQFVRVVQTMPLAGTMWAWLQPMQKSGAPMPRKTLVQRCVKDQAVLRFVGYASWRAAVAGEGARRQVAFYQVLACEVLQAAPRIDEGLAGLLLPHVRAGLAKGARQEWRAAAHAVLGKLAALTTLSTVVLSDCTENAVRNAPPEAAPTVLLLLAALCLHQPHLSPFPDKALKHLVKMDDVPGELAALAALGVQLQPLLAALLPPLAEAHPAVSPHAPSGTYEPLLNGILDQIPIERTAAKAMASAILTASLQETQANSVRSASLARILRAVSRKHAGAVDAAINDLLSDAATTPGSADDHQESRAQRSARLLPLLRAGVAGAASAPLSDNSTTLALAVDAASPQTRILAIRELDKASSEAVSANEAGAADDTFFTQALLRRLGDEDFEVSSVALGLSSIGRIPPAALFDALTALIRNSTAIVTCRPGTQGVDKSDRKQARGLVRKAVKTLEAHFPVATRPAFRDRIAELLLELLLPSAAAGKIPATALRVACRLGHPLLDGLNVVKEAEAAVKPATVASEQRIASSRRIISALALQLSSDVAGRNAASDMLRQARPSAQLMLLLAAQHACHADLSGAGGAVAAALLPSLLAACHSHDAASAGPGERLPDADEGLLPTEALLKAVDADLIQTLAAVQQSALLAVLQALPPTTAATLQADGRTFQKLVMLQPPSAFEQHLEAVLGKLATLQPAMQFLAAAFGGVPLHRTTASTALQVRSLKLMEHQLASAAKQPVAEKAATAAALVVLLPHLLAALSSHAAEVRAAALDLLAPARPAVVVAARAPAGEDGSSLSGVHFAQLLAALAEAQAAVRADPDAATCLVADTLGAATDAFPETPSAKSRGRKKAAEQPLVGPLALATGTAAAVGEFLAGRLPQMQMSHDAAAARTIVRVLRDWRTPGARLLAALPLLRQLAPSATPPAEAFLDVLAVDDAGSVTWQQGAVSAAAGQPTATAIAQVVDGINRFTFSDLETREAAALLTGPGAQRQALSCDLLGLYTAEAVDEVLQIVSANGSGFGKTLLDPFVSVGWGLGQGLPGTPAERLAARRLATPQLHAALTSSDQRRMFLVSPKGSDALQATDMMRGCHGAQGLLWGSMADTNEAARGAARDAVKLLPLKLRYIQAMLEGLASLADLQQSDAPTTAKKRSRVASTRAAATQSVIPTIEVLDAAVAALELLEWNSVSDDRGGLVATLCECLRALAAAISAASVAAAAADAAATAASSDSENAKSPDSDVEAAEVVEQQPPTSVRVGALSYAMRICLSVLHGIAAPPPAGAADAMNIDAQANAPAAAHVDGSGLEDEAAWDVAAVVTAANVAPDSDARRQALRLLSALAHWQPAAALEHVMEVIKLAGDAAATQSDEVSSAVATEALLAVLPAWLAAGRPAAEAAAAVVDAALGLPDHRQLPLLTALHAALPQDGALSILLLELMRASQLQLEAAQSDAGDEGASEAGGPAGGTSGLGVRAGHALDLALSICNQGTEFQRAAALLSVLQSFVARGVSPSDSAAAQQRQLHLALLLAAQQLSRTAAARSRDGAADGSRPAARGAAGEMQQAYSGLLRLALDQLQSSGGGREGVTEAAQVLVGALQGVMAPASYAAALVSLATDTQVTDRSKRKALKLLALNAVATAEQLDDADAMDKASLSAAVDAALGFAPLLSEYFVVRGGQSVAPSSRQSALVAFGSLAKSLGSVRAGPLVRAAPALVSAISDGHRAVRASALAAAAALVHGIGLHAVQLLPQLAPEVLSAAASALAALATESGAQPAVAVAGGGEGSQAAIKHKQCASGKGSDGRAKSEAAALEAAAALAAVLAILRTLPKFISPYLPAILQHTLNPVVWSNACKASGVAETAKAIRRLLPTAVPPRLLLPPLVGHYAAAQAAGAASVVELLAMATAMLGSNSAASASAHADMTFRFLLPALDARQTQLAQFGATGVAAVERAAVAALEALTVKLSERAFKPLFLRLVEWARATLPAAPGGAAPQHSSRPAVLFAAAAALTRRLQSIFVPYFRYLLDPVVAALEGAGRCAPPPKKKRRKSAAADDAAAAGTAASPDPTADAASWQLRMQSLGPGRLSWAAAQALLALEQCFSHDGGQFLDEQRFQRLLPPLVAQLSAGPAAAAADARPAAAAADAGPRSIVAELADLLPQDLAGEADAEIETTSSSRLAAEHHHRLSLAEDPYGVALAAVLVRMAAAAGSDTLHRPLNRSVLLAARGGDVRARRRALAVTHGVVAALREEYALLLPESLPFLAELLEDEDAGVGASAAALVSRLEELTGEGFDQYLKT